jgi:cytochrome c biogenesis factor
MLPLLALLGVGIHARWRRGGFVEPPRRLLAVGGIALVLGIALAVGVYARHGVLTSVGAVLGCFIILSSLLDPLDRLRRRMSLTAGIVGMTLAHVGSACSCSASRFVSPRPSARRRVDQQPTAVSAPQLPLRGGQAIDGPNHGFRGRVSSRATAAARDAVAREAPLPCRAR